MQELDSLFSKDSAAPSIHLQPSASINQSDIPFLNTEVVCQVFFLMVLVVDKIYRMIQA